MSGIVIWVAKQKLNNRKGFEDCNRLQMKHQQHHYTTVVLVMYVPIKMGKPKSCEGKGRIT